MYLRSSFVYIQRYNYQVSLQEVIIRVNLQVETIYLSSCRAIAQQRRSSLRVLAHRPLFLLKQKPTLCINSYLK